MGTVADASIPRTFCSTQQWTITWSHILLNNSYRKSAKRLFFFISGPYHISLSIVIKTYIDDQADEWHKHSRNNSSSWRKWRHGVHSAKMSWGWKCLPWYHRTNEWRGNDKQLSPQSCSLANLYLSPSCNERCADLWPVEERFYLPYLGYSVLLKLMFNRTQLLSGNVFVILSCFLVFILIKVKLQSF